VGETQYFGELESGYYFLFKFRQKELIQTSHNEKLIVPTFILMNSIYFLKVSLIDKNGLVAR